MPVNRTRDFTISVTVGAVVNVLLNFIFIPLWSLYGAAAATIIAEFAVTLYQVYVIRHQLELGVLFHGLWKYLVAGVVMFAVIATMAWRMPPFPTSTVVQIAVGVVVYVIMVILMRANFVLTVQGFIKGRLHK